MFKLYKESLVVDTDKLNDKGFEGLIKLRKKSETKFMKACLYVFYMADISPDNPLINIPFWKLETEARALALGDETDVKLPVTNTLGDEWELPVQLAISTYKRLYNTDWHKERYSFDKKLDQMQMMLQSTQPEISKNENETTGEVSFTSNIEIINRSLASIIDIIATKAALDSIHVAGSNRSLRGALSPLARGKLKGKS